MDARIRKLSLYLLDGRNLHEEYLREKKNIRLYSKTVPRNREMFWITSTMSLGYKELRNIFNKP